jgi:hypothetical protein
MEVKLPTPSQELKALRYQLANLYDPRTDPRYAELSKVVEAERRPAIAQLKAQIEAKVRELDAARKAKKPRWPANTPAEVVKAGEAFFAGTTQFTEFRIHMWDLARRRAVVSYPSGGYSDNGGWHPTPCCYSLLDLDMRGTGFRRSYLREWMGRVSPKVLTEAMGTL